MLSTARRISRLLAVTVLLATSLVASTPVVADELQLTLRDGRVTLIAQNVTARDILTEWAKIGQTTIVNLDQVTSGPVTLEFTDVPERVVLDVLLRSAGGYLAAPRAPVLPAASMYDRVLVMVTGSTAGSAAGTPTVGPPSRPSARAPVAPARPPFSFGGAQSAAPSSPFGTPAPNAAPAFLGPAGTESPDVANDDQQGAIALERPYPTPAAQPLTPLLPGDASTQGTPPSAANPWGVPAGSASTPGVIVQPPQADSSGRTP